MKFTNAMKLSELAKQIEGYIAENGDVDVFVEDTYPPYRLIEPDIELIRLNDGRVKIEL